jgi:hypothetical protein
MTLVTEDGNGKGEVMRCGRFQRERGGKRRGSSMVPEADGTTKSGAVAREAKGDDWRLKVEDKQRKLGR